MDRLGKKGWFLGEQSGEERGKRIIDIRRGIIMHIDQEVQGDEEGWSLGVGSSAQYFRLWKTWGLR